LFFPYTSVNILSPIDYSLHDSTAPVSDYKNIPEDLLVHMRSPDILLISYFSSDVEWNIRKPDYVLPFSMDGRGYDHISTNNSEGEVVDRYSGALMLDFIPEESYYLTADRFSVSKLKPTQRDFFNLLTENCETSFEGNSFKVYYCS
jgi:hypothetical protein